MSRSKIVLWLVVVVITIVIGSKRLHAAELVDAVVCLNAAISNINKGDEIESWRQMTGFIIDDDGQRLIVSVGHGVDYSGHTYAKEFWAICSEGRPERLELIGYDHQLDVALFGFLRADANKER